jgi:cysteine desulfurase
MSSAIYLDYNATAPVRPEAVRAVMHAVSICGNPSSVHGFGRAARRIVEDAREVVAALVGAEPAGVVFTSGATEANALALAGCGGRRVIVSAVEHPSVLQAGDVDIVPVDRHGVVELAALEEMLAASSNPALVAVMLANNETGVIEPVADVARVAHAHGARVHCDAVQAAGRMTVDLRTLGVDSLALSAHKLGGPQGVGALVLADGTDDLPSLIKGGGQERRRRAGTENVPGIAGFAAVARVDDGETARVRVLRDRLEIGVRRTAPSVVVFGEGVDRLPNTVCLAVPGLSAATAVIALDLAGVAVSAGAACSSGKVAPSHVLTAMGAGALAGAAIRVSLGWGSGDRDVDRFIETFNGIVGRLTAHAA